VSLPPVALGVGVVDDDNQVRSIRHAPSFNQARAAVGLDGHPTMPKWQLNTVEWVTRDAVLNGDEH
jgi:hypothetical protein